MSNDYEDLKEKTRRTAVMLFGEPKKGDGGEAAGAYALWKEFDAELAKHISMFYTGRLYAREVITQKQRELCAVASLTVLDRHDELRAHIHQR